MNTEKQVSDCYYKKESGEGKDSDVRGSLKLEASTSKPVTSAGEEISIYVVIRNPFSVPVKIFSTETHIPVDITDQLAQKRYRKKIKDSRRSTLQAIEIGSSSQFKKLLKSSLFNFRFLLSDLYQEVLSFELFQIIPIFKIFHIESDERVAVAVSPDEEESSGELRYFEVPRISVEANHGTINAHLTNKINFSVEASHGTINLSTGDADAINLLDQTDENLSKNGNQDRFGITLYPGDSLVKHFVLKTRRWLFFNPVSHTFQIQVRYRIDDTSHIDTLPFSVDIRAPMRASIIGSVIGSILGFIVSESRKSVDFYSRDFWLSISRTIIFALIIIVAFARKSNVQQVVSVEDFWGGLFTGFLVGYSGDSFIKSILGNGNENNAGNQ
jgi:hypothetical protein